MTYRVLTATLQARTAVHIGSGKDNEITDALVRRDASGKFIIPGTALAGALRTLLTRLAPRLGGGECKALTGKSGSCSCGVCHLMGDINPSDDSPSTSESSRLLVFNATLCGGNPLPFIRDGVGIDRVTGAAARAGSVKFDLETLPAGTKFDLRLELRGTTPEDERLLAAGLAEWQAGRLWLGGRVARGLGAFDLNDLAYKTHGLETSAAVLDFLADDEPWGTAQTQPNWLTEQVQAIRITPSDNPYAAKGWVMITGTLQAEGPLLTNDTSFSGRAGFDHAPLLTTWDALNGPVLAGSGLRGVLRSHAERLARTMTTHLVHEKGGNFLQQCPACNPVESRAGEALASCDALLKDKVSSDEFVKDDHLCLACRLFGSTRRGSRLLVEDAAFSGEKPTLKMFDFLAIDRFTGGAADTAKFDALALWKPAFELRLYLDNPQDWELGWLALVLRDLQDGWLAVGFGAAKGFGRVKLQNWKATFGYLAAEDRPDIANLGSLKDKSGVYNSVAVQGNSEQWGMSAGNWVKNFGDTVQTFKRNQPNLDLSLKKDSYFDALKSLYPVKGGAQ